MDLVNDAQSLSTIWIEATNNEKSMARRSCKQAKAEVTEFTQLRIIIQKKDCQLYFCGVRFHCLKMFTRKSI